MFTINYFIHLIICYNHGITNTNLMPLLYILYFILNCILFHLKIYFHSSNSKIDFSIFSNVNETCFKILFTCIHLGISSFVSMLYRLLYSSLNWYRCQILLKQTSDTAVCEAKHTFRWNESKHYFISLYRIQISRLPTVDIESKWLQISTKLYFLWYYITMIFFFLSCKS